MRIFFSIFIAVTIVTGCKKAIEIDSQNNPKIEARKLSSDKEPALVAQDIVTWMSTADLDKRDFAKQLLCEVLSSYDSIGADSGRKFMMALDSIKDNLPKEKLARVYVLISKPWRLGALLKEEKAPQSLITEIEKLYEQDSLSMSYFHKAYNLGDEDIE